jgi:hypothetical protein
MFHVSTDVLNKESVVPALWPCFGDFPGTHSHSHLHKPGKAQKMCPLPTHQPENLYQYSFKSSSALNHTASLPPEINATGRTVNNTELFLLTLNEPYLEPFILKTFTAPLV